MSETSQKDSNFDWENLGDITTGRQNLGEEMPVIVYRLFQQTLKKVLTKHYGEETANDLIRETGHMSGKAFAENQLDLSGDFDYFVTELQKKLKELKVGIMRIEKSDTAAMRFTLTVSEDLDCSGLPVTDETVCDYDEGFIAGILEAYTGKPFSVKEVDCWASGDRTCRFVAEKK